MSNFYNHDVQPDQKDYAKNYPLHAAAAQGAVEQVKLLLANDKTTIGLKDAVGHSPLALVMFKAVPGEPKRDQFLAIARLLLSHGADPNQHMGRAKLPLLHYAVLYRSKDFIEILLKNGADINSLFNGKTTLHHALDLNPEHVELLLQSGADVNRAVAFSNQSIGGLLPLHIAALKGNIDLVTLLLKNGAKAELGYKAGADTITPFLCAAENACSKSCIHPYYQDSFSLKKSKSEYVEIAQLLATQKEAGRSPLYKAVIEGNIRLAAHLISYGVDIHDPKTLRLIVKEAVETFTQIDLSPDKESRNELLTGIKECIRLLMLWGAQVKKNNFLKGMQQKDPEIFINDIQTEILENINGARRKYNFNKEEATLWYKLSDMPAWKNLDLDTQRDFFEEWIQGKEVRALKKDTLAITNTNWENANDAVKALKEVVDASRATDISYAAPHCLSAAQQWLRSWRTR